MVVPGPWSHRHHGNHTMLRQGAQRPNNKRATEVWTSPKKHRRLFCPPRQMHATRNALEFLWTGRTGSHLEARNTTISARLHVAFFFSVSLSFFIPIVQHSTPTPPPPSFPPSTPLFTTRFYDRTSAPSALFSLYLIALFNIIETSTTFFFLDTVLDLFLFLRFGFFFLRSSSELECSSASASLVADQGALCSRRVSASNQALSNWKSRVPFPSTCPAW